MFMDGSVYFKYAWSYTLNHDKPMSSDTWRETYVGPKHFKFITHFPKYADSAPKKGKNVHFLLSNIYFLLQPVYSGRGREGFMNLNIQELFAQGRILEYTGCRFKHWDKEN